MATVTFQNSSHFKNLVKNSKKDIAIAIKEAFEKVGSIVEDEKNRLIFHTTKTGRWYKYHGIPVRASAPNEPFANRSGATSRSFDARASGNALEVGYTSKIGLYLEKGTKRMEARPTLLPALVSNIYVGKKITGNSIFKKIK